MAVFATRQAPASIRKVAFEHLQQIAGRLLGNLFDNQATDEKLCASIAQERGCATLFNVLTQSIERECGEGLARWWREREGKMQKRAAEPGDVPPLAAGFTPRPRVSDLLELGLVGMHLLVRHGESDRYAYFCPDEHDESYWLAPYCYRCVRDGLELRADDGTALPAIEGLTTLEVQGDPAKLGSHLAVRRGLCQYIPDLFADGIRQKVGYAEIDILSRNRSSLYLVINDPPAHIESKPEGGNPSALLIIQSAIPNLFGPAGYVAFDDELYNGLGFFVNPGFFRSIFDLLFRGNREKQIQELLAYARLLSDVARTSDSLAQDIRRDERSAMSHTQRKVWGYVANQFDALRSGADPNADSIRLGRILLDHLALSSDLGLDRLSPDELRGGATDMRELAGLLPILAMAPSENNWFKSMNPDPVEALCTTCCNRREIRVKLPEPIVAAIWLDFAENATKYGFPRNGAVKPQWIWGCVHQLPKAVNCHILRSTVQRKIQGWQLEPASVTSFANSDVFLGAIDFTPIPQGISSANRPRLGFRMLMRLVGVISTLSEYPVHVGFGPPPTVGVHKDAKKVGFAVFPKDLCSCARRS